MSSPPRRKPRSLAEFDPRSGGTMTNGASPVEAPAPARAAEPEVEEGVPVSFLVTPLDRKRLRHYCTDADKSFQQIAHEAMNEYLERRGLPPLQPQTSNRAAGGRKKQ